MNSKLFFFLVEKVANESQKTPRDVVMMENFHHIFATLSRLKISCLEAEKKEAKQKYTDHLQSYVIYSLGQPLEKLNVGTFESLWVKVRGESIRGMSWWTSVTSHQTRRSR